MCGLMMCEGREADGARGCPVALQKQLKALTGIVQITVTDHQRVRALQTPAEREVYRALIVITEESTSKPAVGAGDVCVWLSSPE